MLKSRLFGSFMVYCVLMLLTAPSAWADKVTINLGHVAPPIHPIHLGALQFKKYVEDRSGGSLEVKIFPMGQLGGEQVMAENVQQGILQMASLSDGVLANFVPEAGIMNLPFVFPNRRVLYQVLGGPFGNHYFSYFPRKGMVPLGWGENGFRNFLNTKRDIQSLGDMKGLKFRSMEGEVYVNSYQQLGINPIVMPWPEVINALRQGMIDGTDLSMTAIYLTKTFQVAKHVTISNWVYSGTIMLANKPWFDQLSPDQREIIKSAALIFEYVSRTEDIQSEFKCYDALKEAGVTITNLTETERLNLVNKTKPVHDQWITSHKNAKDLYDLLIQEIAKHK